MSIQCFIQHKWKNKVHVIDKQSLKQSEWCVLLHVIKIHHFFAHFGDLGKFALIYSAYQRSFLKSFFAKEIPVRLSSAVCTIILSRFNAWMHPQILGWACPIKFRNELFHDSQMLFVREPSFRVASLTFHIGGGYRGGVFRGTTFWPGRAIWRNVPNVQ